MLAFLFAFFVVSTTALFVPRALTEEAPLAAVDLGGAANFAILTKTGISTVPTSAITGNIGVSPITAAAVTGFSLSTIVGNTAATLSSQVTGFCYASDYTDDTPTMLAKATFDVEKAYDDAAALSPTEDNANYINVGSGLVNGRTFTPGVYQWDRDVSFTDAITFAGSATDIFIFKTTGNIIVGSGARVGLSGGAVASNIFWQVGGFLDAGTTSHLEGVFLVKNHAVFKTGSSLNGRVFAQTAVTLDSATIVEPPAE